jgi:hypothetical protein
VVVVVDVYFCVCLCRHGATEIGLFAVLLHIWSFISVTTLELNDIVGARSRKLFETTMLAVNFIVHTVTRPVSATNVTFK